MQTTGNGNALNNATYRNVSEMRRTRTDAIKRHPQTEVMMNTRIILMLMVTLAGNDWTFGDRTLAAAAAIIAAFAAVMSLCLGAAAGGVVFGGGGCWLLVVRCWLLDVGC